MERETAVLVEEKRVAPAQSQEWDRSSGDGGVAGVVDEREGGEKLEVAMEEGQTMPNF